MRLDRAGGRAVSGARKLKPAPGEQPWAVVVKEDLAGALELPVSVVARRTTIPILTCLLLRLDKGELLVEGTDTDIGAQTRCPVREHGGWPDGAAGYAVDAQLLAAVVAAAPKRGEIRLTAAANGLPGLLISHGLERARLAVLPGDEFPGLKEPVGHATHVVIEGAALAAGLARVAPAISREETRYYLNGVFLEIHRGGVQPFLDLTATDGHRLHHTRLEPEDVHEAPGAPLTGILPRRLVELLATAEGRVGLGLHAAGVTASGGFGLVVSRLIDGQYPDWRRIVPAATSDGLELGGGAVVDAVKRLRAFGNGALAVKLEKERLSLQGATSEGADLAETCVAGKAIGAVDEMQTGFKGAYLADAARIAGGDLVLSWSSSSAPLRVSYPDRPDDVTIVMPMRMQGWREVGA